MRRLLRHPSPGTVLAFIALVVALAGTATALPGRNQVKRDDIAANSVLSRHIRNGQVNSADIRNRSVQTEDLADLTALPRIQVPVGQSRTVRVRARSSRARGAGDQVDSPFVWRFVATQSDSNTVCKAEIDTDEDNSAFSSAVRGDPDFDAGEGFAELFGFTVTAAAFLGGPFGDFTAVAPDGTVVKGQLWIGFAILGFSGCTFGGNVWIEDVPIL
jgi:hypothetical protein